MVTLTPIKNKKQEEIKMKKYQVLSDHLDSDGNPTDNSVVLETDSLEEAEKEYHELIEDINKSHPRDQKRLGASLMELDEFGGYGTVEFYVYEEDEE